MITFVKPTISRKDLMQVLECMLSEKFASGELCARFEKKLCEYTGGKYFSAVSSVSAAVYLILKCIKISPGDEIIISALTDIRVLEIINCFKAVPVVADTLPQSFQIDPEKIKTVVTDKTKAVIIGHTLGYPADIPQFLLENNELLKNHNIAVIEDCCHSLGSVLNGQHTGTAGDFAFFSFDSDSTITTETGGAVLCKNRSDHLQIKNFYTIDDILSSSGRIHMKLSDIQAAMGLSEISLIAKFLQRRREIGDFYAQAAGRGKHIFLTPQPPAEYNYYRFPLIINSSVKMVTELFKKYKIEIISPIKMTAYEYLHLPLSEDCNARNTAIKTICIPLYPTLKKNQIEQIGKLIANIP